MKPYDFKWTKFYETNADFPYPGLQIDLAEDELFICSTVIDADNFSIVTTRRLFTRQGGLTSLEFMQGATERQYGDFKGRKGNSVTLGLVQLQNGKEVNYFIETGKASMVMIHGVRTLIRISGMDNKQIENSTRILRKHNGE